MQHDYEITRADANTGISFRAAVNAALQALATNNAGYDEPANPYPCMWWPDQENDLLKIRNTGNTEWIVIGKLSEPGFGLNEKTLYAAYSILTATEAGAPAPLTIAEDTLLGRLAGGGIAALSVSEVKALLAIATDIGAALTDAASYADALASALDGLKLSKAANLSDINNPADAFVNIKQLATEEATGVSRRATMAEAIEGEGNEAHVTPMEAAAMAETKVNPKSQSQGISKAHEIAGIYVPDNANLRIGTGDMAMIVKAASPNWTKNIHTRLIDKFTSVVQKAPAAGSSPLRAATVFNDKIYAIGSGVLYEWNGVDTWVSKAPAYLSQTAFYDMTIFNNELYAGSYTAGYLFKWNGTDAWVSVAAPITGYKVHASAVLNNELYAMGATATGSVILMKWDGLSSWVNMCSISDSFSQTLYNSFSMTALFEKLYVITVSGQLLEYNAVANSFATAAPSISSNAGSSYACGSYNGTLYTCTGGGALYSWNGVDAWSLVLPEAAQSNAVTVLSLVEHEGFLYCGLIGAGGFLRWDGVADTWEFVSEFPISAAGANLLILGGTLYTLTTTNILYQIHPGAGYFLSVLGTRLIARIGSKYYKSSTKLSNFGVVNDQVLDISVNVKREALDAAGQIDFYVNTRLLESFIIPPGVPENITETANLYLMGHAGISQPGGTIFSAAILNRALTHSEIKQINYSGIAYADKAGSQSILYQSNFSAGVDGWSSSTGTVTGNVDGIADRDNVLRFYANELNGTHSLAKAFGTAVKKLYELTIEYLLPTTNTNAKKMILFYETTSGVPYILEPTDTWKTVKFLIVGVATYYIRFAGENGTSTIIGANSPADDLVYFASVSVKQVGVLGLWEPNGIQPAPGQWLDSSGNNLHALQPATGTSLVLAQNTFEVRWVNTWAGTHEAQYIGGVNQNILPPGAYIQDIIGIVSGSTGQNIIVGDGSTTNRFVASVALANGTQVFTLANRMLNGINAKLVADPDANFTGSISWIIRGIIL
jgi:hypothetical protein